LKTTGTNVTIIGQNDYSSATGGDTFLALPFVDLCSTKLVYFGISASRGKYDDVVLIIGTENGTVMNSTVTQSVNVKIDSATKYILECRKSILLYDQQVTNSVYWIIT